MIFNYDNSDMALIKCTECKKEISSKADKCPHCGCPLTKQSKTRIRPVLLFILFALTAGVILDNCSSSSKLPKNTEIKGDNSSTPVEPYKFPETETKPNLNGKWIVHDFTNPTDDSKTVVVSLDADSGIGKYGDIVSFTARCKSNKTEVYVNWDSFLGIDSIPVTSRVGNKKATQSNWSISTDRKASFRPRPIGFLKELIDSNRLVLQTTPYGENPITAIFDVTGINNAIKPLREECGW